MVTFALTCLAATQGFALDPSDFGNVQVDPAAGLITWNTGDLGGSVRIVLYKGSSMVVIIASATVNDGSFYFDFPSSSAPGSDYRVCINHLTVPEAHACSDFFTLPPDAPFGLISLGLPWVLGQEVTITWSTGGLGGSVQIHLYEGSSQVYTISSGTPNDGSFTWVVPEDLTPGTDYRVKITHTSSGTYDYSDYFTITGGVTVTQPTSSTTWTAGQSNVTITRTTGGVGGNVQIHLYKGSSQQYTISSSTSNDGSYTTWDVPSSIPGGTDYRVRVYYNSEGEPYLVEN